jgi:hypothetical protein
MQLLHRLNPAFVFSRAHASSSRLLAEQIFIVLVKLTLPSPNSKCSTQAKTPWAQVHGALGN